MQSMLHPSIQFPSESFLQPAKNAALILVFEHSGQLPFALKRRIGRNLYPCCDLSRRWAAGGEEEEGEGAGHSSSPLPARRRFSASSIAFAMSLSRNDGAASAIASVHL